MNINVILNLF